MVYYLDTITLLKRDASSRTPYGTSYSDGIPNGDLTPWRIRLELVNTAQDNVDNSGRLTLRVDNEQTFLKTGPRLLNEDAKTKFLIEAKISQTISGSTVDSKVFRFFIGNVSLDVDSSNGSILSLTLQELQYRTKESFTSRELRFKSPNDALDNRVIDFNTDQVNGVNISLSSSNNKLPVQPELEYVPNNPQSIKQSFDQIVSQLSEAQAVGGVFNDFYYDFDPSSTITMTTNMIADEIGRVDSGIVMNPLSEEALDSDQEQSSSTDFVRFKNHVIVKGSVNGGTLPTNHSIFSSKWEHAKLRESYNSSRTINDRYGNTHKYMKGEVVKRKWTVSASGNMSQVVVTRYFQAIQDVPTSYSTNPENSTTYWKEDFIVYPEFDKTGSYNTGDIVYYDNGSSFVFYRAQENIHDFTLGKYREWDGGNNAYRVITSTTPNLSSHLDNTTGFLKLPTASGSGWVSLSATVPSRTKTSPSTDTFAGFSSFSPWTNSIFDWEKNMVGLAGGVLPYGTGNGYDSSNNRYVGLVPDWNLCKDVYEKQDHEDQYESISIKWVHQISNSPPSSALTYHGQRILVGSSGTGDFVGQSNKLAQYDNNTSSWHFSKSPDTGDTIINFDDGKVYQWSGSAWSVAWQVEGNTNNRTSSDVSNPLSPASPFHLVKDVYKVQGFEGTPNSGIEFRYAWETEGILVPSSIDSANTKSIIARKNSRGAWIWFWNPFPRLSWSEGGTSRSVGEQYGGNGSTVFGSGFTTLNIYNNSALSNQTTYQYNRGLKSEDLGKISAISFKIKFGIYAAPVNQWNDDYFSQIPDKYLVVGEANMPMVFWAVDMFDRVWYKTFTVRYNGKWQQQTIQFGDMSQANLYIPRWDELSTFLGIPLSQFNFMLKEKEYTGVAFDWRFVRGWGIQYMGAYDSTGFYNAGIDEWKDKAEEFGNTVANGIYNIPAAVSNFFTDLGNTVTGNTVKENKEKLNIAYSYKNQATIALDDLHYVKELVVNSDETDYVSDPRTEIKYYGNVNDYLTAKALARSDRERLSFYPQYWHLRSFGDVRMRVGKSFKITGDRIPENPDQYNAWSNATTYAVGDKVSYDGYTYMSKQSGNINNTPSGGSTDAYWENINKLVCAEVKHIIDHTGYHMEVIARRKFVVTGE